MNGVKEYLISLFVDDELDLDDKITFVQTVHHSRPFTEETIELLEQEKMLRGAMVERMPPVQLPREPMEKKRSWTWFAPFAGLAAGAALAVGIFFIRPVQLPGPAEQPHRFVIYRPDVSQAKIVGDFTHWSPVDMQKIGESGYWAITLNIPEGEHRYSYLVDNNRQIPDPTVPTQEPDDFGGRNSVISVKTAI